jgi:hypothetical protein
VVQGKGYARRAKANALCLRNQVRRHDGGVCKNGPELVEVTLRQVEGFEPSVVGKDGEVPHEAVLRGRRDIAANIREEEHTEAHGVAGGALGKDAGCSAGVCPRWRLQSGRGRWHQAQQFFDLHGVLGGCGIDEVETPSITLSKEARGMRSRAPS